MSSKKTPDSKAWFGISSGTIMAAVVGLAAHFGFNVTGTELTLITVIVGLVGHFAGTYLAPYEPRMEEIVTQARNIWNNLPQAPGS